jgi:hypothetical protein
MNVTAKLTRDWKKRWWILTGFFAAGALWFYYDGFIAYPQMTERYAVFEKFAAEVVATTDADDIDDHRVKQAWEDYAMQQGMDWKKPKNKDAGDYRTQKICGSVLLLMSLGLFGWYKKSEKQSVQFDGKNITDAAGREVKADWIYELDRRKWENKGIVYALYQEDGKKKKLTLDDFKFAGCDQIIDELERRLSDSKASV